MRCCPKGMRTAREKNRVRPLTYYCTNISEYSSVMILTVEVAGGPTPSEFTLLCTRFLHGGDGFLTRQGPIQAVFRSTNY